MRKASTLYTFDYQPTLRVKRGRFTHKSIFYHNI